MKNIRRTKMKNIRRTKMKKSISLLLMTAFLLFAICLFACQATVEKPTITLTNKENVSLDLFETIELSVEVKGTDKDVSWTSSDNSIAKVEDGVVTGLKVGNAVITASVEGVSDTCNINVYSSENELIMTVTPPSAKICTAQQQNFEAKLRYKHIDISDMVEFSWNGLDSDFAIIHVNEAHSSRAAVVAGDNLGQSTMTVAAVFNEEIFSKTIDIEIVENLQVAIANLTAEQGAYHVNLAISDINGDISEFTPDVRVLRNGNQLTNPVLAWELKQNDNIVSVDASTGKITALNDGNAVVTCTYVSEKNAKYTLEIAVNVVTPKVKLNNYSADIDLSLESAILSIPTEVEGTVSEVVINGVDCFVCADERGLIIDKQELTFGKTKAYILTDKAEFEINVTLCTLIIRNAEQFDQIPAMSRELGKTGNLLYGDVYRRTWDGYFVLANNIEYNGTFGTFCGWADGGDGGNGGEDTGNWGFQGTFDGRGYVVSGMTLDRLNAGHKEGVSLFATLGKDGVIKNVGFVDAVQNGGG